MLKKQKKELKQLIKDLIYLTKKFEKATRHLNDKMINMMKNFIIIKKIKKKTMVLKDKHHCLFMFHYFCNVSIPNSIILSL